MSSYSPRGNKVVQQQRVEGPESAAWTFDGLIDGFGRGINPVGIVTGSPSILDVVPCLELFEAVSTSIVDVLSVGDELRRGRSVGGRHFEWRTG